MGNSGNEVKLNKNQPKWKQAETGHNVGASPTPMTNAARVDNFWGGKVTPMPNRVRFYLNEKTNRVFLRSDSLVRRRIRDLRNFAQTIIDECESFNNR